MATFSWVIMLSVYLGCSPDNTGHFQGRAIVTRSGQIQLDILQEFSKQQYDDIFKAMRNNARTYANYIFALTMGTGKTILMATCIFYEFLLSNKFPNDKRFCHNALVFAPDKTVLQSLKEIQTFDMAKVVPPEYVNFLTSNIKFHFLDDTGATLTLIDQSRFNVVVSNTQKIILKRQSKEKSPLEKLLNSGKPTYEANSVQAQIADLYNIEEPLLYYRIHKDQTTYNGNSLKENHIKIRNKFIEEIINN